MKMLWNIIGFIVLLYLFVLFDNGYKLKDATENIDKAPEMIEKTAKDIWG